MKCFRPALTSISLLAFACSGFAKDTKPGQAPPMTNETRLAIIRLLNAEFVWTRKPFPMGEKGIVIKPNGEVAPDDANLKQMVEAQGEAAKAGERVQITNVVFKGSEIRLEING